MKVKNVSGGELTFKAGKRTFTIANEATQTLEDTMAGANDVADHIKKRRLEIVELPPIAQFSGTPPRFGYALVAMGAVIDTNTLTVNTSVFEIDEAANGVTGSNTAVTAADATDVSVTAAGLKAAINADTTLDALGVKADDIVAVGTTEVYLVIEARGTTAIGDITVSAAGGTMTVTKVAAADGVGYRTSVVSATAAAATVTVNTGLDSITDFFYSVRTAAGAGKAYDGTPVIGGGAIFFDDDGSTDIAATDVVTVLAIGK